MRYVSSKGGGIYREREGEIIERREEKKDIQGRRKRYEA